MKTFLYAFKYLLKIRGNNLAKTASITLGLFVSSIFLTQVVYVKSYNNFIPEGENVYRLESRVNDEKGVSTLIWAPVIPALKAELPEIAAGTVVVGETIKMTFVRNEQTYPLEMAYADTGFFNVFRIPVLSGVPSEALRDPGNIFLSRKTARLIFGNTDPVGQVVTGRGDTYRIAGVFEDLPRNTHLKYDAVFALEKVFHILIIEDGSPDGTANIVKTLQQEFPERLFMIERKGKLGLGTAYIVGFKWSLEHNYEYIFEMDADFSHNPADLPRLYKACAEEGADVSIGSRYVSGVNVVNWPMGRVLMSYFASKYVRLITGLPIHDTTAGFKCYRREVLQTIDLDGIRFKGYAFQIEMKFTAYKCGFKIVEVPVIFINRELGTSKMNSSIFGEAVFGVIKLKMHSWFHKYPQAVKNN